MHCHTGKSVFFFARGNQVRFFWKYNFPTQKSQQNIMKVPFCRYCYFSFGKYGISIFYSRISFSYPLCIEHRMSYIKKCCFHFLRKWFSKLLFKKIAFHVSISFYSSRSYVITWKIIIIMVTPGTIAFTRTRLWYNATLCRCEHVY